MLLLHITLTRVLQSADIYNFLIFIFNLTILNVPCFACFCFVTFGITVLFALAAWRKGFFIDFIICQLFKLIANGFYRNHIVIICNRFRWFIFHGCINVYWVCCNLCKKNVLVNAFNVTIGNHYGSYVYCSIVAVFMYF